MTKFMASAVNVFCPEYQCSAAFGTTKVFYPLYCSKLDKLKKWCLFASSDKHSNGI